MYKLLQMLHLKPANRRRVVRRGLKGGSAVWMREQLVRMQGFNQGVISMRAGR